MRLLLSLLILFGMNQAKADTPSCGYYRTLADISACNYRSDYPIGYGYKYCNISLKKAKQLKKQKEVLLKSHRSQYNRINKINISIDWIENTIICLQDKLIENEKVLLNSAKVCDAIEDFAIDSHVECYAKSGFCENQSIITKIVLGIIGIEEGLLRMPMYFKVLDACAKNK